MDEEVSAEAGFAGRSAPSEPGQCRSGGCHTRGRTRVKRAEVGSSLKEWRGGGRGKAGAARHGGRSRGAGCARAGGGSLARGGRGDPALTPHRENWSRNTCKFPRTGGDARARSPRSPRTWPAAQLGVFPRPARALFLFLILEPLTRTSYDSARLPTQQEKFQMKVNASINETLEENISYLYHECASSPDSHQPMIH